MKQQNQTKVYPAIGHCIYCGKTTDDLSKEHIIPLGLGGTWILPKSSCSKCSAITRDVEQFCLRPMLGPLRIRMQLPTRRTKERPNQLHLEFVHTDGRKEKKIIPSEQYPFICMGYRFPAPGLLRGLEPKEDFEGELVARYIDTELKGYLTPDGRRFKIGSINILAFSRMLAKIAHSYAVAELGEDSFEPLLPDLILGKSNFAPHLVGGDVSASVLDKEPGVLHNIYLQDCITDSKVYTLVTIRLFAFADMPRYHVVIGRKLK